MIEGGRKSERNYTKEDEKSRVENILDDILNLKYIMQENCCNGNRVL